MLLLGLTGSIGMGKSTTAALFAAAGVPVHDADATVHALYRGEAVAPVEAAFPGVAGPDGIDRGRLAAIVTRDPAALKRLEALVHPLVRAAERRFLERVAKAGHRVAVVDVPLLFETGGDRRVDAVVVVTAPEHVQRARVLARPGMSEARFAALSAKQVPDAEKRRRAHALIDTSRGVPNAARQVRGVLRAFAGIAGSAAAALLSAAPVRDADQGGKAP